jgi:thiamine-phosphate pyrophosphorylase
LYLTKQSKDCAVIKGNTYKKTETQKPFIMYAINAKELKLVVITNPYDLKFECDKINRMFEEGLDALHVRKPQYDDEAMKKYITQIDAKYHDRLILHSHFGLIKTFDIQKIHISRDWINSFTKNFYLNKILLKGKEVTKSMTISNCSQLYKPLEGIDELMLGPVFARASYTINNQQMTTAELEKGLRHSKLPVTALGGVTTNNIEFFKSVGFKGLAIQSGVWKTSDPVKSFVEIKDHNMAIQQELRIAV